MRLTIGRDKTGTVNGEDHILFQQVDVMNDLIVGTLEECGINTHHREHSLAGQTGRKGHSVLFCHANIKKALGVRMVEELQASAIFHGGGNGTDLLILTSLLIEQVAKHGRERFFRSYLRVRDTVSQIKGRNAMEVAGVFLCRSVALALFGHNMEEMGAWLAADGAQRALQLCFVMAVNGSEIMEPHILKHGRMVHGPAHHALTALNGGFERRTDHGDPIQKRPDVLFCINVTARGAQMAEIPCQRTNVFGNGHLVVVEDHQQVVQPANVVHPLVDHAARERAIANDGNHMARLPP